MFLQDKLKELLPRVTLRRLRRQGESSKGTSRTKLLFFLGPSCFCIPTYLAVDKFLRDWGFEAITAYSNGAHNPSTQSTNILLTYLPTAWVCILYSHWTDASCLCNKPRQLKDFGFDMKSLAIFRISFVKWFYFFFLFLNHIHILFCTAQHFL